MIIGCAAIGACLWIYRLLSEPAAHIRCPRCEGKGHWIGTRGREDCDWCDGSGQLPVEE